MIQQNPYFREIGKRFSHFLLPKYFPNMKIVDGCSTTKEVGDKDMFSYFSKLDIEKIINSQDDEFFVFSQEDEGRNSDLAFKKLYHCLEYGIPPKKIVYLTGNQLDIKNLNQWHKDNNLSMEESINIVQIFWPHAPSHYHLTHNHERVDADYCWNKFSKLLLTYYRHNKLFLQGSRVIRGHRTYANFRAYESGIRDYFLISQDKILRTHPYILVDEYESSVENYADWLRLPIESEIFEEDDETFKDPAHSWDITFEEAKRFMELDRTVFPLTIDQNDFDVNWAMIQNKHLSEEFNFSALFNVVMETSARSDVLFFSEKTSNALALFQPFIIYGNPNINQHLRNIGFESYDEIFDYSFDSIAHYVKRYDALLEMLKEVVKRFSKMSKEEQLKVRFSLEEKLRFNYNLYMRYCINHPHNPPIDSGFITMHGPIKDFYFTTSPALGR